MILWFAGIYMKNRFWYTIISISIIWSLIILFLWSIPLFDQWPDISWFEKQFSPKLLIYSNIGINEDKAYIQKDQKNYKISQWLSTYDIKIPNSGSQIIFKSDNLYQNTYWFIVFRWWNFVQIEPQSAINIYKTFQIEILTWNIQYYPSNPNNFMFTWEISANLQNSNEIINIIQNWYNNNLKIYIKDQFPSELIQNKTVLKISQKTLKILSKLFPNNYTKNLQNLQNYLDIFDIDLDTKNKLENQIDTKSTINNILWGMKKWIQMVE